MRYYMTPDYQRAKGEAIHLLQKFGLEKPPVNPMDIAQHLDRSLCEAICKQLGIDKFYVNRLTVLKILFDDFYLSQSNG